MLKHIVKAVEITNLQERRLVNRNIRKCCMNLWFDHIMSLFIAINKCPVHVQLLQHLYVNNVHEAQIACYTGNRSECENIRLQCLYSFN